MTKHINAELMMQYAQDAMETDTPWERWEFSYPYGTWVTFATHPNWGCVYPCRRKPKVILINGIAVPEPMRAAPETGSYYYIPRVDNPAGSLTCVWDDAHLERRWLARGLCHSTKEAADLHAKALLSFTEQ